MTVYSDKDLPMNWLPPISTIWPKTQNGRLAIAARKQAEAEEEQAKQIREREADSIRRRNESFNRMMNAQAYGLNSACYLPSTIALMNAQSS